MSKIHVCRASLSRGGGMASQDRLPVRLLASYGVGSLGTATFSTVPGLLLLYYLTDVLGASAGLAGAVLFLPKVWDVVVAPLLGAACDSSAARRGSRRPWLLVGGLGPVSQYLLGSRRPASPLAALSSSPIQHRYRLLLRLASGAPDAAP